MTLNITCKHKNWYLYNSDYPAVETSVSSTLSIFILWCVVPFGYSDWIILYIKIYSIKFIHISIFLLLAVCFSILKYFQQYLFVFHSWFSFTFQFFPLSFIFILINSINVLLLDVSHLFMGVHNFKI